MGQKADGKYLEREIWGVKWGKYELVDTACGERIEIKEARFHGKIKWKQQH